MTRLRLALPIGLALSVTLGLTGLRMRAQDRPAQAVAPAPTVSHSAQDALLKPFHFTFNKPTPLADVARELSRSLGFPVVVDRAAVDRLGLKPDDEIQLELDGVRLKTGLKLLLDQLDLTFKVVPEDNLIIFTDNTGSEDPFDRVLSQVKELHRDIHDLQDSVDEIRSAMGLDEEGAKMRKPTIIEEVPAPGEHGNKPNAPKDEPATQKPSSRSRPGL